MESRFRSQSNRDSISKGDLATPVDHFKQQHQLDVYTIDSDEVWYNESTTRTYRSCPLTMKVRTCRVFPNQLHRIRKPHISSTGICGSTGNRRRRVHLVKKNNIGHLQIQPFQIVIERTRYNSMFTARTWT